MKKRAISIAAAGALALGLIGCGSSNGSSSSTTTVKGVDGYVMNAKISVKYWDPETNTTKTYNIPTEKLADNYFLSVNAKTNKKRQGKATYALDLNDTVANHIISITMTSQSQGKLADGSVYFGSFFDADGNGEYNSSIDVSIPAGITLKAPKGYSIITPISTLIANQVEAKLATDKNESNLTAVIDTYTKNIINALGVDENTLKHVDPLSLKNSNDPKKQAFIVANAFAGALIMNKNADKTKAFNALKGKTAKTAKDVISNLAAAAKAAGDNNLKSVLDQLNNAVAADSKNLKSIINANLDKTRTASKNGQLAIVTLQSKAKEFNLTNYDSEAGANGYKINPNDLDSLSITLDPNDKNISNKDFVFVIKVANPKNQNNQDANVSSLTVKVPFEVNATDGTINAAIPDNAKIVYEGMNSDGSKVITKEVNSSVFGSDNILSTSNNKITIKAKTIVEDIDNNASNAFFGGNFPQKIVQIQAGFNSDSISPVDNNTTYFAPKTRIISDIATIDESVIAMIAFDKNKDLVADMRHNTTQENLAPNNDLNLAIDSDYHRPTGVSKASDTNATTGRVVVNNNTSLDINLTASTADNWENNTTVAWSLGKYLTDKNLSTATKALKANSSADAFAKNAIDVNTTSTEDGNLTTYIKYTVTDEFGESNTTTAYLVVNRAPVYVGTISNDKNFTIVKDHDDFGNLQIPNVTVIENNGTSLDLNGSCQDVNVTNSLVVQARLVDNNKTIEFNESIGDEWNLTVEINATDGYANLNITSSDNKKIKK